MHAGLPFRPWIETLMHWCEVLTRHNAITPVDHVGAYAGSYLVRRDWDHN